MEAGMVAAGEQVPRCSTPSKKCITVEQFSKTPGQPRRIWLKVRQQLINGGIPDPTKAQVDYEITMQLLRPIDRYSDGQIIDRGPGRYGTGIKSVFLNMLNESVTVIGHSDPITTIHSDIARTITYVGKPDSVLPDSSADNKLVQLIHDRFFGPAQPSDRISLWSPAFQKAWRCTNAFFYQGWYENDSLEASICRLAGGLLFPKETFAMNISRDIYDIATGDSEGVSNLVQRLAWRYGPGILIGGARSLNNSIRGDQGPMLQSGSRVDFTVNQMRSANGGRVGQVARRVEPSDIQDLGGNLGGGGTPPVGPGSGRPMSGPVIFNAPPNATQAQIDQTRAYVEGSNEALRAGALSPTGRVSTLGQLRTAATLAANQERARALAAGTPYQGVVGHVPDTTWTGTPHPHSWLDLDRRVNSSLGGQSLRYPIGYRPTEFIFR
jgi:hypothetical protein